MNKARFNQRQRQRISLPHQSSTRGLTIFLRGFVVGVIYAIIYLTLVRAR